MKELRNKWVLVTGASSGLGEAMALLLAEKYHIHLLLVARRVEKLDQIKQVIQSNNDIDVELIQADLTQANDVQNVANICLSKSGFYGAILNAGQTYLGKYLTQPIESQRSILSLNVNCTVQLADAIVKHFELNGNAGRLMVVSSLAAKVPAPYQAVYSGTKAFLTNFFHSLKHELKNKRFKLSVFSPGGIKTEMTNADGFQDMEKFLMPVDEAAAQAVQAFIRGSHDHIPGLGNRIGIAFLSLIPTRIFSRLMGDKYLKSIEKSKG